MSITRPAKFPWWAYWLFLGGIVIFAFAPLLSVIAAVTIAEMQGCTLTEHDVHPCLVGEAEIGGLVATLFVLGYFAVGTLPLGGAAFLVWLASLIIHRIAWVQVQKGTRS